MAELAASTSTAEEKRYSVEEKVPAISKRTMGKLIVKYCGNEGQNDDQSLAVSLRRILQATITKLDTESDETWKNAEIVIYDQQGNYFCIRSGEAENKFVVQLDEKDDINIMCTERKKRSVFSIPSSIPSINPLNIFSCFTKSKPRKKRSVFLLLNSIYSLCNSIISYFTRPKQAAIEDTSNDL